MRSARSIDELERLGIPSGYQTILVACGLARRTTQRELEGFVTRDLARRFHGHVVIHDAEDPELAVLDDSSQPALRVNRALVETELVLVVTAAETVLHGGPGTLLGAADAHAQRAAGAYSLLETSASQGWHLGVALERALARRLPVIGVSLVLNHPRTSARSAATRTTRRRSNAWRDRRSAMSSPRCPIARGARSCTRSRRR